MSFERVRERGMERGKEKKRETVQEEEIKINNGLPVLPSRDPVQEYAKYRTKQVLRPLFLLFSLHFLLPLASLAPFSQEGTGKQRNRISLSVSLSLFSLSLSRFNGARGSWSRSSIPCVSRTGTASRLVNYTQSKQVHYIASCVTDS